MALQKKRSNSSRLILTAVTLIVVAVVGYILYRQFYLHPDRIDTGGTEANQVNRVIRTFGEDILQDPRYRSLVQFGTDPVAPQDANPNPFQ